MLVIVSSERLLKKFRSKSVGRAWMRDRSVTSLMTESMVWSTAIYITDDLLERLNRLGGGGWDDDTL